MVRTAPTRSSVRLSEIPWIKLIKLAYMRVQKVPNIAVKLSCGLTDVVNKNVMSFLALLKDQCCCPPWSSQLQLLWDIVPNNNFHHQEVHRHHLRLCAPSQVMRWMQVSGYLQLWKMLSLMFQGVCLSRIKHRFLKFLDRHNIFIICDSVY